VAVVKQGALHGCISIAWIEGNENYTGGYLDPFPFSNIIYPMVSSSSLASLVSIRNFIPRIFELFSREPGKGYSWRSLGRDCVAGLTVGVVALPVAMAFSIAAGWPTEELIC
jgi:hypothetical protein